MKRRLLLALVCLLFVGSCGRKSNQTGYRRILDEAESYEFYSLSPEAAKGGDAFHGYKVLGMTTLDRDEKATVNKALFKALDEKGKGAKCFDPRHGIRAKFESKTVDLVICFACGWVEIYEDGKERQKHEEISASAELTFNEVLSEAGIPLDKKYNK